MTFEQWLDQYFGHRVPENVSYLQAAWRDGREALLNEQWPFLSPPPHVIPRSSVLLQSLQWMQIESQRVLRELYSELNQERRQS